MVELFILKPKLILIFLMLLWKGKNNINFFIFNYLFIFNNKFKASDGGGFHWDRHSKVTIKNSLF